VKFISFALSATLAFSAVSASASNYDGGYLWQGLEYSKIRKVERQSGYVEEYTSSEKFCESWMLLPGSSLMPAGVTASALMVVLLYVFLGMTVLTDIFVEAVAKITSKTEMVEVCDLEGKSMMIGVPVWNSYTANVTLLALASSAPELFLCFFSTFTDIEAIPKDIGPIVLVGSGAFNLLIVTGVSILSITEIKKVKDYNVFVVTAAFATFAYVWIFLILVVFSPAYIEFWEATMTLSFYPILLTLIWMTEKCSDQKWSESEELE
jgi:solute carrier family 8 (sodium/calcium exchanger)